MNIKNLKLLADWVEENVPQEKFDMGAYRQKLDGDKYPFISKSDCGTIGCFAGWGPFVPGLEVIDEDFFDGVLSFKSYIDRVFDIPIISNIWEFLFDDIWHHYDNTVEGAVARARILIKYPDLF